MKTKRNPCYASKGLPKVPGKPKGTDIIPAWLTPGEAVLSPGAAEMLGRGNVRALNEAAGLRRPQYKALGDDGMQPENTQPEMQPVMPDLASLGNQRVDEILSNPDTFKPNEVRAANRYMDPAGLAGGPSEARDQAFLGNTRSLGEINNPEADAFKQQYTMAQRGLFGGNRSMRRPVGIDSDGLSKGLSAAQEAVSSGLSYGQQAAQEATQEGIGAAQSAMREANERARYFSKGTERVGLRKPQYFASGVDEVFKKAAMEKMMDARAALRQPAPSTGTMYVSPDGRIAGRPIPSANLRNFTPLERGFNAKTPAAPDVSKLSNIRNALNGSNTTSVGDVAKGVGRAATKVARTTAGALEGLPTLAVRVGLPAAGMKAAYDGFNTPTEDYAKRIGVNPPTTLTGDMAVRGAGVMSDVGANIANGVALPYNLAKNGLDTGKWYDYKDNFADIAAKKSSFAADIANAPRTPTRSAPEASGVMKMDRQGNLMPARETARVRPGTGTSAEGGLTLDWASKLARDMAGGLRRDFQQVPTAPAAFSPKDKSVYIGGMRAPFQQGDFVSYKDDMGILRAGRVGPNGFSNPIMNNLNSLLQDPGMAKAFNLQAQMYNNDNLSSEAGLRTVQTKLAPYEALSKLATIGNGGGLSAKEYMDATFKSADEHRKQDKALADILAEALPGLDGKSDPAAAQRYYNMVSDDLKNDGRDLGKMTPQEVREALATRDMPLAFTQNIGDIAQEEGGMVPKKLLSPKDYKVGDAPSMLDAVTRGDVSWQDYLNSNFFSRKNPKYRSIRDASGNFVGLGNRVFRDRQSGGLRSDLVDSFDYPEN
jgi:hypothetical protein